MPSKWRQKELGTTRCGPPGPQRARSSSDDPHIRSEVLPPGAASAKQPNDLHCTFTPLRTSHPRRRDWSQPVPVLPGSPGMLLSNVGWTVRSSGTSGGQGGRSQSGSACSLSPPTPAPPTEPSLRREPDSSRGLGLFLLFFLPPVKQRAPCTRSSALGGTHRQNADPETLPFSLLLSQCAAEAGCRWKPVCGALPSHP